MSGTPNTDEPSRPGRDGDVIAVEAHAQGCVLPVRVQPASRRAAILGRHSGLLKVAVTAPPEKGKANDALLQLLRKPLGVQRSALEIIAGHTSREKKVLVYGVDAATLRRRLSSNAGDGAT